MTKNEFDSLLIEKYRPSTLDDLCISDSIKSKIKEMGNSIPHLLFVGPCGTGKTTLAKIIVEDVLKCDYLYINASDESGIDTIRQKVSGFVQTKSFDGGIKVVILDEYDGSSAENQKCLRNLMESYAKYARFIITGNFQHKIIKAISSRCTPFSIRPTLKDALKRCLFILNAENVKVSDDQKKKLAKLVKSKFPDLRETINLVQKFIVDGELQIEEESDNSELCEFILKSIKSKKTLELRKHLITHEHIFDNDYERLLRDLLNTLYKTNMDEAIKKSMIITIADHLYKNVFVTDKEINAFACFINLENL